MLVRSEEGDIFSDGDMRSEDRMLGVLDVCEVAKASREEDDLVCILGGCEVIGLVVMVRDPVRSLERFEGERNAWR
jgi:hypothetical protein